MFCSGQGPSNFLKLAYVLRSICDYSAATPDVAEEATCVAVTKRSTRAACMTPREIPVTVGVAKGIPVAVPVVLAAPPLALTAVECSECESEILDTHTTISCLSCRKLCHSSCCQNTHKFCSTCERRKMEAGGALGVANEDGPEDVPTGMVGQGGCITFYASQFILIVTVSPRDSATKEGARNCGTGRGHIVPHNTAVTVAENTGMLSHVAPLD